MTDDTIWAALGAVEAALTAVLTLAEGLSHAELLGSRLTRREVRRQLLDASSALAALGAAGRDRFAELDWDGFAAATQGLRIGGAAEDDALRVAVAELAPGVLSWIRVYRRQRA